MLTGLRSSEIRALTWDAINLKAPTLSVTQRADRWNDIGSPKSGAGHRTIPIGPGLVKMLKAWKLRCPPSKLNLAFPNQRGGVIDQKGIIGLFLALQVEAGLAIDTGKVDAASVTIWKPRYGLHSLRHAAASAWIKQGIDLKRLQVWIGHATIQLTIDTYGHPGFHHGAILAVLATPSPGRGRRLGRRRFLARSWRRVIMAFPMC